ncbi:MAG: hypothetical protein WC730_03120 [Patescibacteria group bacterium]|jgi:hypothetical protein
MIFRSLLIFSIMGAFFLPSIASAQSVVPVYLFWRNGCPHCENELEFLETMKAEYPISVQTFEVSMNAKNLALLQDVGAIMNTDVSGVPFTVIGEQAYVGFSETYTGETFKTAVSNCVEEGCADPVKDIVAAYEGTTNDQIPVVEDETEAIDTQSNSTEISLTLPFLGTVDALDVSLPLLSVVIGALDGFNPCAMWTLIFLLSMLLGMHNKWRMWILGGAFIVSSAAVYFLFMTAWLNLMLFIGMITAVQIAIALVALGAGFYNLREYFVNKESACKVTAHEDRKKIFERIREIVAKEKFYLALGGIILLAGAVNMVELFCSAGFPAIFTQVLTLANLPTWQYYAYVLLYIFFFMLDDLLIFAIAMVTLQVTGITTKYSRLSHFIGGILMLVIGFLLIFKPGWLMFT